MISQSARNKISCLATATLLALGLALIGCGKSASSKMAAGAKAFETASPALKDDWSKILAAANSHDYTTAILTCRKLQAFTELTPEQRAAVNDTMTAVNNQFTAAVAKGDADALKALQDLRQHGRGK